MSESCYETKKKTKDAIEDYSCILCVRAIFKKKGMNEMNDRSESVTFMK